MVSKSCIVSPELRIIIDYLLLDFQNSYEVITCIQNAWILGSQEFASRISTTRSMVSNPT